MVPILYDELPKYNILINELESVTQKLYYEFTWIYWLIQFENSLFDPKWYCSKQAQNALIFCVSHIELTTLLRIIFKEFRIHITTN